MTYQSTKWKWELILGKVTYIVAVKRKVWEDFEQFELVLLPISEQSKKKKNWKTLLTSGAKRNKIENSENNFIAFYNFQICYSFFFDQICYSLYITFLTIFVTKKKPSRYIHANMRILLKREYKKIKNQTK